MRLSRRVWGVTAVTALAVATTVTLTQAAAADPVSAIDWKPCEDAKGVECATVEVPLDYDKPDGEKIKIGLAKRAATDPGKRVGSLLIDPGGPGGSGVSMIKDGAVGSKEMQASFDQIGFDPRGVNTSTKILCDKDDASVVRDLGVPESSKEFAKLAKANKKLAAGCRDLSGPLFDHADNLHTVEDIESVRQALGDEKLNFLGYSYGTLMGQQYAEKYPENIRTMVLDGNMDHSLANTWEFASTETAAAERNFDAFAKWCDATASCALNGDDTAKTYGKLRDAARAGDLTDPESGEPIGFYDLTDSTFNYANNPGMWSKLAENLKNLRDGSGAAKLDAEPAGEPVELIFQAAFCADWDVEVKTYAQWQKMAGKLAKKYPDMQWSSYVNHLTNCVGGPVETTNPQQPLEIDGTPPLVTIGNLGDFATVYEWSEVATEQSGATLITYEGYGHTAYGKGIACVDEPVEAYFIDGKKPENGISCASQDEPGKKKPTDDPVTDGVGPFATD